MGDDTTVYCVYFIESIEQFIRVFSDECFEKFTKNETMHNGFNSSNENCITYNQDITTL